MRTGPVIAVCVLFCLPVLASCSNTPSTVSTEKINLHPPQSVKDGPQLPLDDTIPGITNFGLISKDVWRGAQPTEQGMHYLATLGVKTIIDLREEADESSIVPPGVHYVRLPVSPFNADLVDVQEVLRQIDASPKPVFIHCHQGRDRTGLAVAAYRLAQGMPAADACAELRNFHVNLWWDAPIERRIHDLDRTLTPAARKQLVAVP